MCLLLLPNAIVGSWSSFSKFMRDWVEALKQTSYRVVCVAPDVSWTHDKILLNALEFPIPAQFFGSLAVGSCWTYLFFVRYFQLLASMISICAIRVSSESIWSSFTRTLYKGGPDALTSSQSVRITPRRAEALQSIDRLLFCDRPIPLTGPTVI